MPVSAGSPPPADPRLIDLLTGDSVDFAATLGNWTKPGGGTLTRDTGRQLYGNVAAAKFAVTTTGQVIECPVPGTFKAGVDYWAVFAVNSDAAATLTGQIDFGLLGTDSGTPYAFNLYDSTAQYRPGHGVTDFVFFAIRWRPTANRTGVKLRFSNNTAAGSYNWWLGLARVFRAPGKFGTPALYHRGRFIIPFSENSSLSVVPWTGPSSFGNGLQYGPAGQTSIDAGDTGKLNGISVASWNPYLYSEHTPADMATDGFNVDMGNDYVGWYWGELDSTHAQWFAYNDQYIQLKDAGAAGFSHRRAADPTTLDGKIEDSFQWAFYVAGAQTVGANKALYFQTPAKAIIDEVRIHLGTAPTGATFIVDVNDDGVTIFTTQANRPTIAISGTDATSGVADGGVAVAKNSVLTIDVDQIGSTIAGSDLVVFVRGRMRW